MSVLAELQAAKLNSGLAFLLMAAVEELQEQYQNITEKILQLKVSSPCQCLPVISDTFSLILIVHSSVYVS